MIHSHYDDGSFRMWGWNRQLFEVSFKRWGRGPCLIIELPSDWHDDQTGTLTIGLWLVTFYIMFPWYKRYEDHMQCSGPMLGFSFFEDILWLYHGNATGSAKDKSRTTIHMPWHWKHCVHEVRNADGGWEKYGGYWDKGEPAPDGRVVETHYYTYTLKSGEVQHRTAKIHVERRTWRRNFWFPRTMTRQSLDVWFDDEVGERSGSWKGGTLGCGYDMLPGESAPDTLRRMERDRTF